MLKKITELSAQLAVFAVLAVAVQFALPTQTAVAAAADSEQQQDQPAASTQAAQETYRYVAQEGDTYHALARKAAQTFGLQQNVQVGEAGIVFVETNLANQAGLPQVSAGQTVEFSRADVQRWMEAARNLSEADKAAWQTYVAYINFDTNSVGAAQQ